MKHVVSFSGGRTSAYLVHLMEQKRINEGWDVEYVFMDTGAEHPKTYEFVRNVVKHWGINLRCIRSVINPSLGIGPSYKEIELESVGWDLSTFFSMTKKHGNPYLGGAFCTERLKYEPFRKFAEDMFGAKNYKTWIGFRIDEPSRAFGKKVWDKLGKYQFNNLELRNLYFDSFKGDLSHWRIDSTLRSLILSSVPSRNSYKSYLFELSDFDKQAVTKWWESQPFNLELDEWLGNCVFCFKKSLPRIAAAMKQEPELLAEWKQVINSEEVRQVRPEPEKVIYRRKLDIDGVVELYEGSTTDDVVNTLRLRRGCAVEEGESCEVFGCQMDLFGEAA